MQYYTYRQNNSGGVFDEDKKAGIGYAVAVQALNADHADHRAREIGIYFDGVESGIDCDCCGDRWYRADEGFDEPGVYSSGDFHADWGLSSFIHHIDGTITEVATRKNEERANG